jgi:hypothetical protein
MKSSSSKKNMHQANALGSRPISRRKIPGMGISAFDGWFTATKGITKNLLNNPNTVSGWANLVPGGADFAQSTSNLQPALTTINGLVALAPDGESGRGAATDVLVEGDMIDNIGTGDFYIGMVYELETAGSFGSRTTIIQKQAGSGSNAFSIQISTLMDFRIGASVPYSTGGSPLELNKTTFLEVVRTDGVMKTYVNGTEVKSAAFTTNLSCNGDLKIGQSDMKIGEFICKKGTMPDKQRQIIEALMARKWNIGTVSTGLASRKRSGIGILPAGNRFRNQIPRF